MPGNRPGAPRRDGYGGRADLHRRADPESKPEEEVDRRLTAAGSKGSPLTLAPGAAKLVAELFPTPVPARNPYRGQAQRPRLVVRGGDGPDLGRRFSPFKRWGKFTFITSGIMTPPAWIKWI